MEKLNIRGSSAADQCRSVGLKVGDTIIGRESGFDWWQESKLTLLWIGKTKCVFAVKARSKELPNWRNNGEFSNWTLGCRDWYKVKQYIENQKCS